MWDTISNVAEKAIDTVGDQDSSGFSAGHMAGAGAAGVVGGIGLAKLWRWATSESKADEDQGGRRPRRH